MKRAIRRIQRAYSTDSNPWVVAYSGGKDSTALLKLLFAALHNVSDPRKPVTVVYCDTGVEIPVISDIARANLTAFESRSRELGFPVDTVVIRPPLEERFFVKVLGNGYPPPTDKFRWCTDRLAIDPIGRFLRHKEHDTCTVMIGVRQTESATRSLTIAENTNGRRFWSKQKGVTSRTLFMPILDFSIDDVWAVNLDLPEPAGMATTDLADLYACASETPETRGRNGAPSGAARFGCWTCTVSKHGVTLRNLIATGHADLLPLLAFRLWIERERQNPRNRWRRRRNGDPGPGPMTKQWRRKALDRLLVAEAESGYSLITREEVREIQRIWRNQ